MDRRKHLDRLEADLFLEALYRAHGYDLRDYARPSLHRRLDKLRKAQQVQHLSALLPLLLHQPAFLPSVLNTVAVPVSGLFRDPEGWRTLREQVLPWLKSFPRPNLWIAGCARGEEADTLAICLHEAGLLERSRIYATDFSAGFVGQAEVGEYSHLQLESGEQHYRLAGGQGRFRDYFDPTACGGKLRAFLRASSSFSTHNLVSDGAFIEAQCVLCRNVLIYFSPSLRQKVLKLLKQSLCPDGYLWLGHQETVSDPALTLIAEPSLYRLPCPTF